LRQATSAGGAKTKSAVTEYKHLDGSFLSLVGALEVIWAVLTVVRILYVLDPAGKTSLVID
jgi:hypothetical protein